MQNFYKPLRAMQFPVPKTKWLKTPQAQVTLLGRETFVFWALPILFAKMYYHNHWAAWRIKELIKT